MFDIKIDTDPVYYPRHKKTRFEDVINNTLIEKDKVRIDILLVFVFIFIFLLLFIVLLLIL